jgi:cardiolipin synthase A/B
LAFFWQFNLPGTYGQIILFLQAFVAIFLATHILLYKQNPQSCLGWLLAVALSPVIAAIFYLGVGLNPFAMYAKRMQAARSAILKQLGLQNMHGVRHDHSADLPAATMAEKLSGFPPCADLDWQLLVNSGEVYSQLYEDIARAKSYVFVQFYQIQADDVGFKFLDALESLAKRGVAVYVIFDALGSFSLKRSMVEKYQRSGIQFHRFLAIHPLKRRFQVNWRNHRKLVVIDGEIAYTGGFNIGKTYLQGDPERPAKWFDILLKVKGTIVHQLEFLFRQDWYFATRSLIPVLFLREEPMRDFSDNYVSFAQVIPSGPSDSIALYYSTLVSLIHGASKSIWIMSPYFVLDKTLFHALELAKIRGLDVKITMPLKSNHPLTDLCASSYFDEYLRKNITVLRYTGGVCHAKVALIDDEYVLLGSSNADYRSHFLNFETDLLLRDTALCREIVEKVFSPVWAHSVELTPRCVTDSTSMKVVAMRLMRLIAPLM